ncbi:MAG: sigma-70 family RNA polymerase sigma factor [Capsulimonadaceae bacterium]
MDVLRSRLSILRRLHDIVVRRTEAAGLSPAPLRRLCGCQSHTELLGVDWATPFGGLAAMTAAAPGRASLQLAVSDDGRQRSGADDIISDFDAVVVRYEKQLFNVIFQWIGDYDEALDLTQETFVSAYRARDQFRGDSKLYTWLYRIAYNHCKNRFKQRDRQRQIEGLSLDAGLPGDDTGDGLVAETRDVPDWSFSPSRILEQKELRALVDRAVNSLASEYRAVLILREVDGLSYNEIAEVTGLTLEAVKTRLNRARGMVRLRVEPYMKT